MTRNLAAARRKGDPANGCCVEAEELWQLELGRCYKIGKAGGGVPSYGVHVVRHAKKYLRTVGHSHTYECLRSFDYVGPCSLLQVTPFSNCMLPVGTASGGLVKSGRSVEISSALVGQSVALLSRAESTKETRAVKTKKRT